MAGENTQTKYNSQVLKELKQDMKDLEGRILLIETSRQKTEFQYNEIMKALDKLNNVTIPDLMRQVDELRNKPVKRYDQAITGILGAIFGAIGTIIANKILGGH